MPRAETDATTGDQFASDGQRPNESAPPGPLWRLAVSGPPFALSGPCFASQAKLCRVKALERIIIDWLTVVLQPEESQNTVVARHCARLFMHGGASLKVAIEPSVDRHGLGTIRQLRSRKCVMRKSPL